MGRAATLKVDIVADARGVGKGVDDASGKLGKLGAVAGPVGLAIGAGLALGVGALVKFGASAVRAASGAQQSMGAVESVFGKASKAVVGFADDSAMRLGLAKTDYMDLAAVVGSQLKNMGKSQAEAAKESDRLITVGADLAATFGGSVSDAVGAVGSLLRGERDPIERYGIAIKDADIKARLAADGQNKLTGAAKKTAEANATLKLLTEQAGGSLGAFGRESNTLAGVQERLKAKVADLQAEVGARLLPIVTRFAQYLLTEGVPALDRLGQFIVRNKNDFINFGATVAKVVLFIGQGFLEFVAMQLDTNVRLIGAFRGFLSFFFGFAKNLLDAAGTAFGWLPGVGAKIDGARAKLGELSTTADAKLAQVEAGFKRSADGARRAADAVAGVRDKVDELRDKAVRVTVTTVQRTVLTAQRDGRGGGLSEFSGGPLQGFSASYGGGLRNGGGLATAALGDVGSLAPAGVSRQSGGLVVVDRRTIDARSYVDAVLLDDRAVARLERAQRDHATRMGGATAYGGL